MDQQFEMLYSLFLLCIQGRGIYQSILKLHPYIKLLWKTRRGLELAPLPHFLHDFSTKLFLLLYSIYWPNFKWKQFSNEDLPTKIACLKFLLFFFIFVVLLQMSLHIFRPELRKQSLVFNYYCSILLPSINPF